MNVTLLPEDSSAIRQPRAVELRNKPTIESEKKKLYKAAKDIESLFMYQLLKSMRQTIPESSMGKGMGLGDGLGKDIYTQMFDQELAEKMSGISDKSLASMLYKSMEKQVEARFGAESGNNKTPEKISPNEMLPARKYIEVKPERDLSPTPLKMKSTRGKTVEFDREEFDKTIDKVAEKYELNPELIRSVIRSESNFNPRAVSEAGAKGLMQLIDTTATDMGVKNIFDPEENLEGGAKYLKQMLDRFGDIKLALAAYNAGPGAVDRHGGIPPYPETREYVKGILARLPAEETSDE